MPHGHLPVAGRDVLGVGPLFGVAPLLGCSL